MLKKISLLFLCCSIYAREIRSPLLRDDPGYRLMPLEFIKEEPLAINAWIEPFSRNASSAYCSAKNSANCCKKCPLSTLIFGEGEFTGAQALSPSATTPHVFNADGTNRTISCNPLLLSSLLKPCLSFHDRGVMFALQIARRIHDCWSIGIRASVPYRSFKINLRNCCTPDTSIFGGETLNSVVDGYAYRLDFLSKLAIGCTFPQNRIPVVNYADSLFLNNPITISNQNVTDAVQLPVNARNPVTLIHRADGSKPEGQLALPLAVAQSLPALPGNGVTTDPRARFVDGTSYVPLGTDPATQSTLWVVPSLGANDLVPAALVIRDEIERIINSGFSAEDFFELCGDCFASQTQSGVGDIQTEFFLRHQITEQLYIEGLFGLRFPTGKQIKNPHNVFQWSTGNNGHIEYRLGGYLGYQPRASFMVNLSSYFTWVGARNEPVLASYEGATVKNIGGPCVLADIKWSYYVGSIDAIWMREYCKGILGIDVGYELYNKRHDTIRFKQKTATNCFNMRAILNTCALEKRTHVLSHKIRTTAFYDTSRADNDDYCVPKWSIFGGYDVIVGGKNIPREHGPHAGIMVMY